MTFQEVNTYIETSIFQNQQWINLTTQDRERAFNNALSTLQSYYRRSYFSIEALAYQSLWVIESDDYLKRADQGVKSINVDGISLTFNEQNRLISPHVQRLLQPQPIKMTSNRRAYRGR